MSTSRELELERQRVLCALNTLYVLSRQAKDRMADARRSSRNDVRISNAEEALHLCGLARQAADRTENAMQRVDDVFARNHARTLGFLRELAAVEEEPANY